ncbi:MAG: ATP-grasp domain-containing protein [Phycisphaeraceae bacterium]
MTKPKLLVLGASRYQLPTIKAAQSLGMHVVSMDNVPTNGGHAIADESCFIDTTDIEAVLSRCEQLELQGVISPATDVAVATAARVAERFNLPGPPVRAADVLCSKEKFRQLQRECGLPFPRCAAITGESSEIPGELRGGACIIKPDGSSGSKGIFIVHSAEELARHLPESLRFSRWNRAIIEEYIVGHQGTLEAILDNGRIVASLLTDRLTPESKYTTTLGHLVPATLSDSVRLELERQVQLVCDTLGIKSGPLDCDFVVRDKTVYLLEMTPRLGGNSLSSLWMASLQIDFVEYCVKYACGMPCANPPSSSPQPTALLLLGVWKQGLLHFDDLEAERLANEPWVKSLVWDHPRGATVSPFINGRYRVGEAVLQADSRAALDERVAEFHRRLKLEAT